MERTPRRSKTPALPSLPPLAPAPSGMRAEGVPRDCSRQRGVPEVSQQGFPSPARTHEEGVSLPGACRLHSRCCSGRQLSVIKERRSRCLRLRSPALLADGSPRAEAQGPELPCLCARAWGPSEGGRETLGHRRRGASPMRGLALQHAGATEPLKGVCTQLPGPDCSALFPYEEGTSE